MKENPKEHRRGLITEAELRRAFTFFNKYYFDGKLHNPYEIKFKKLASNDGASKRCDRGYYIHIEEGLRRFPNFAIITLLHEMAHVARQDIMYPDGHGMQYSAEIIRLFNAGAYEGLL